MVKKGKEIHTEKMYKISSLSIICKYFIVYLDTVQWTENTRKLWNIIIIRQRFFAKVFLNIYNIPFPLHLGDRMKFETNLNKYLLKEIENSKYV